MSWLLTQIEVSQNNGSTTTTVDTPSAGSATSTQGAKTVVSTSTRTPAAGTRSSSNTVNTAGQASQYHHYAIRVSVRIPVHNRQPVASS